MRLNVPKLAVLRSAESDMYTCGHDCRKSCSYVTKCEQIATFVALISGGYCTPHFKNWGVCIPLIPPKITPMSNIQKFLMGKNSKTFKKLLHAILILSLITSYVCFQV